MGVRAQHHVHGGIKFLHHFPALAAEILAVVDAAARSLDAAFVHHHDDGLDTLRLDFGNEFVDGRVFRFERQARSATRPHDRGCAFQGKADERHFHTVEILDHVSGEKRLAGLVLDHVGREKGKRRTRIRFASRAIGLAFLVFGTAAGAQTLQVFDAVSNS